MISALTAYKDMIQSSAAGKTLAQLRKDQANAVGGANAPAADAVDLSVSSEVFSAVDSYLNLNKQGRFDSFHKLSPQDKEQFVKIVAALAQAGYVGYEELVVNKKVEKHDATTQIGDERLHGAKVYQPPKI
jgi:hypothetical protein